MTRRVGLIVPVFSIRSSTGWGIGEIPDLEPLTAWMQQGGFSRLMILPLGTIQRGETSPYAATSTLSIDPVYIALSAVDDFARAGGEAALSPEGRDALSAARSSARIDYDAVRRAKFEALDLAYREFRRATWDAGTARAAALASYIARERDWIEDYALFQALASAHDDRSWRDWPPELRDREPAALDSMRRALADDVLRHQYWQWLADQQWQQARRVAREDGVEIFGDLPFVANMQSPEVWARAQEFMLDVSCGVPPDAFSESGQDWGLPTYRWEAITATNYEWVRRRGHRMASLYDGLRIDHVIGIYRTYGRPKQGEPFFNPGDEPSQIAQGESVLTALKESGLTLVAEDLGVVPDFLRPSLGRLSIPGCKVMRWERDWHADGQPFLDPATYPALSVAMTGTHDTEPLPAWWAVTAPSERHALLQLPALQHRGFPTDGPWTEALRDALIELAYGAGSADVFLPVQDLFGWPDRVNTPGTVGPENWTWSLPWPIDRVGEMSEATERRQFARSLAAAAGRLSESGLH